MKQNEGSNPPDQKKEDKKIDQQEQEFTCPLCLDLIVEPVTTQCKHSFCDLCVDEMFDRFDKMICPLDRISQYKYDFQPNPELKQSIMDKFPEKYQLRNDFYKEQKFQRNSHKNLNLEYGNYHDQLFVAPGEIINTHKVTFYTKICNEDSKDFIKTVTYTFKPPSLPGELHETDSNIQTVETKWPFQLQRMEWGTYNVKIKIQFKGHIHKDSDILEISHYSSFARNGDFQRKKLIVDANKLINTHEDRIQSLNTEQAQVQVQNAEQVQTE